MKTNILYVFAGIFTCLLLTIPLNHTYGDDLNSKEKEESKDKTKKVLPSNNNESNKDDNEKHDESFEKLNDENLDEETRLKLWTEHDKPLNERILKGEWQLHKELYILTVEVAKCLEYKRKLEFNNLRIYPVEAAKYFRYNNYLEFRNLRTLELKAAQYLASQDGISRSFWHFLEFSEDVQKELLSYHNRLHLNGIKVLTVEIATSLCKNMGYLYLDEVEEMSMEVARIISQKDGLGLSFAKFESYSDEVKRELVKFTNRRISPGGELILDGIEALTVELAKIIIEHKKGLTLLGLKKINSDAAQILMQHEGELEIRIPEWTKELAKITATYKGWSLNLNGFKEMTPEIATILSKYKGKYLEFYDLENIDAKTASALTSEFSESLILNRLNYNSFTVEVAKALTSRNKALSLFNVKKITPEVASVIAQYEGYISLGIDEIDIELAKILANIKGELYFTSTNIEIDDEIAKILAKNEGIDFALYRYYILLKKYRNNH